MRVGKAPRRGRLGEMSLLSRLLLGVCDPKAGCWPQVSGDMRLRNRHGASGNGLAQDFFEN